MRRRHNSIITILVETALICAIVTILLVSIRHANGAELCATKPGSTKTWWSYRLVNGKQCWYAGKRKRPIEELRWAASVPTQVGQPRDSEPVLPSAASEVEPAFNQLWRGMMYDINAAPWLKPVPIQQWRLP